MTDTIPVQHLNADQIEQLKNSVEFRERVKAEVRRHYITTQIARLIALPVSRRSRLMSSTMFTKV